MPSMSPRTQQMQSASGAGIDQATQMFEKGFSEMAYNVLLSRFPDLMENVVTFKILDTDLDKGMGIGAFVVMRGEQPLYIPVVLSDNNLKPIELLYHKSLNLFLPLTKAWLTEVDKSALDSLGKGIKTPETLYSDVDIRSVVVPPVTGRFSYASYVENPAQFERAEAIALLEKTASEPKTVLLEFLSAAPNFVKQAFYNILERNPRVLKHAAQFYGVNALKEALQPRLEKVAAKQSFGGALWIADKDTTPTEFKRIFGDRAGEAYAGVRKKGYAAKDERLNRNMAVQEQPYEHFTEPHGSGVYTLYGTDMKEHPALVIANPINLLDEGTRYGRRPAVPGHIPATSRVYPEGRPDENEFLTHRSTDEFFAIFPDGDYLFTNKLVGRESIIDEISDSSLHKRIFKDVAGEPRQGLGFWVRQIRGSIQATVPVVIKSITTDSEGVHRYNVESVGGFGEKQVLTDPTHPFSTIKMPKGSDVVYLPPDFIWVPLKNKVKAGDYFTSGHDLSDCISSRLSAVGAKKVSIKNAGANQFSLNGAAPMDKIAALKKLSHVCTLDVETVATLLEKAASERHVRMWVASPSQLARIQLSLEKKGADDEKKKPKKKEPAADAAPPADPAAGGDPMAGGDPSMDPNAQAAMMAPPPPPPPSPIELAAMEFQQHIDSEMQKLQEKAQMLQALTQRTQEISSGAPPMPSAQTQAMGAPPAQGMNTGMSQPPPGVGAAPLPGSMPQPGMGGDPSMMGGDPSMMGGDPSMGGMPQPGMEPGMGGMPQPGMEQGMDPSMSGMPQPGMEAGMDPSMGGMPPQPGMDPSMMGAAPGGALPPGGDPSMMGGSPAPPPPPMAMMGPDGMNAQTLGEQVNPQFLDQAAQMQSGDIFDAAAVSSLAQSPAVKEMVGQYLPNLEKALDNLGRVLLTLWMQEPELKSEIGETTFADLEDNLRSTTKSMGDLVLKLSQGAHAIKGQFEHEEA